MHNNTYASPSIRLRPVAMFFLIFAASLAALLLLVRLWPHTPNSQRISQSLSETPALPQPLQPSPTHPTLEWEDMQTLRDHQQSLLNSAGPLPNDPAHTHIPIDDAMNRLLNSGALTLPWINTTQPWQRPKNDVSPHPTVENRT